MTLILWSGGCDSTLILRNLLKEEDKRPIRTLALTHPQVMAQKEHQNARREILARLRKQGFCINHTEIEIESKDAEIRGRQCIPQSAIWLGTGVPYLIDDEDLYVGYIRTDDVWHHIQEYREAFKSLSSLCGRSGKLQIPLELASKGEVISQLKEYKLLDLVWWCETPKNGKRCGRCGSCITHQLGIKQIELEKKIRMVKKRIVKGRMVKSRIVKGACK